MALTERALPGRQESEAVRSQGSNMLDLGESEVALIAKALSHPVRLRLLHRLCDGNALRVKEMVSESRLAQSTISEHLRILRQAGLVAVKREGSRKWYYGRPSVLVAFAEHIDDLVVSSTPEGLSSRTV